MKKETIAYVTLCALVFAALIYGGRAYSIGSSFAEWNASHQTDYFINMHARLLSDAGIAISLLCFALAIGLSAAFSRIRQLEALVRERRMMPNQSNDPMP
jgi:hypothetical protein